MRSERKRINEKEIISVVQNAYYSKKVRLLVVFAVRLLLSCIASAAGMIFIAQSYKFNVSLFDLAFFSVAATAILVIVCSLFNRKIVIPIVFVLLILYVLLQQKTLANDFKAFWDTLMINLDSRLLSTRNLMFIERRVLNEVVAQSCQNILIILAALYSFFVADSTRIVAKSESFAIVTITAFLCIPAFVGEIAGFYTSLIFFLAALFAIGSISTVYSINYSFLHGKKKAAQKAIKINDKEIANANGGGLFIRARFVAEANCKYIGSGIATFLIITFSLGFTSYYVNYNDDFNLETLYQEAEISLAKLLTDASSFFNFSLGEIPDNGYFSDINASEISNKITINSPTRSNVPVLEVIVEDNSIPLYLRGDIGYAFDGSGWKSIMNFDVGDIGGYKSLSEALDAYYADYPEDRLFIENFFTLNDVITFDNVITDTRLFRFYKDYYLKVADVIEKNADMDYADCMYTSARLNLAMNYFNPDDFFGLQNVKLNYQVNSKAVIVPMMPYENDYRISNVFDCFGDFVLRLKPGQNFIKSYETVALYPKNDEQRFLEYFASAPSSSASEFGNSYSKYVDAIYTTVPTSENANIEQFSQEIEDYIQSSEYAALYNQAIAGNDNYFAGIEQSGVENTCLKEYILAISICDYFSQNYKYSLSVDNSSGENTIIGNFLFDNKSGHCALYASAMTLLMRESGFPARYVTGYVAQGASTQVDDGYLYTLREKNLHAWTEVYFEGIGWLPFDPTSSNSIGYLNEINGLTPANITTTSTATETEPEETTITTTETAKTTENITENSSTESSVNTADSSENSETENFTIPLYVLIIIAAIVVLALIILLLSWQIKAIERLEKRTISEFAAGKPAEAVRKMNSFILKMLTIAEFSRHSSESLQSFAVRIDKAIPAALEKKCKKNSALAKSVSENTALYSDVVDIIEKAEFSGANSNVTDEERQAVLAFLKKMTTLLLCGKTKAAALIFKMRLYL